MVIGDQPSGSANALRSVTQVTPGRHEIAISEHSDFETNRRGPHGRCLWPNSSTAVGVIDAIFQQLFLQYALLFAFDRFGSALDALQTARKFGVYLLVRFYETLPDSH
jgi:hypothetical protein